MYEYLIAGLPELRAAERAPLTMDELRAELDEALSEKDKEQLHKLDLKATYGVHPFIQSWYAFDRALNNMLVVEICKKHGLDVRDHVLGEPDDDVDNEVRAVSKVEDLYERERAIDNLRFAWLEEATKLKTFSFENIVAYYLELQMLCRWDRLTTEVGEQVFRQIVKDMKKGLKAF